MVTVTPDPTNPERLVLTATVSLYLDRLLLDTLNDQLATSIREQAIHDLKSDPKVKKQIAAAATRKLLSMLGVNDAPTGEPQAVQP